jgi:hypothetical protein
MQIGCLKRLRGAPISRHTEQRQVPSRLVETPCRYSQ